MREYKLALLALGLLACAPSSSPSGGDTLDLFRDFTRDWKFDEAGHPLNAWVTEAESLCKGIGQATGSTYVVSADSGSGVACQGPLGGGEHTGSLTLNVRLRATPNAKRGTAARVQILDGQTSIADVKLAVSGVRNPGQWMNLPVPYSRWASGSVTVIVTAGESGDVEFDYFELFPSRFNLVLGPGSGVFADSDTITIECSPNDSLKLTANGSDVTQTLNALIASGSATNQLTQFRRLVQVKVGDLLGAMAGAIELTATTGTNAANMQILRAEPGCQFDGDPNGKRVLVTGFQPFPVNTDHDNISAVAVSALRPSALSGAQVMRLILPVEYDQAPAEVQSAIARCNPDVVISFGQGGAAIALEHTAYNSKSSSEVAGGAPDNRGSISTGEIILPGGPDTFGSTLPLDQIASALSALGESPETSTDPGRYVCNDVFYSEVSAISSPTIGGFIHLPYTDKFDDSARARFGQVVETVVEAAVK